MPEEFRLKAAKIRRALGDRALRIDHIGSTSIQGLAAKPIIDVQVSVADFEPIEALTEPMETIGYIWRSANPELTKRYFRERPGKERTQIHVRRSGSWHEQWALLFRDYMRVHTGEHPSYVALKHSWPSNTATREQAIPSGKQIICGQLLGVQTDCKLQK